MSKIMLHSLITGVNFKSLKPVQRPFEKIGTQYWKRIAVLDTKLVLFQQGRKPFFRRLSVPWERNYFPVRWTEMSKLSSTLQSSKTTQTLIVKTNAVVETS